jgi:type IV pilus assembly protein PilA
MLRKIREAQEEEGFTLIELLVVVLIIGILAAIAIPVFLNQREKAYANAVESDVRNLALVMEDYASDNNGVYSSAGGATFLPSDGVTLEVAWGASAADGFCIQGQHEALPATTWWVYDVNAGASNAQVAESSAATCGTSLSNSVSNDSSLATPDSTI